MAKIIVNNPRQVINGGAKKYYFKVKGLGGPKGDKGDKGDTGSQGPQGPQGNAATVSIGSTTTLPVGYDATVTNSGSIYNAVLNFGIPQGPRGPQGATGATGAKGDKGDQGNPGPQGEKGTNATVYVGTTSTLNPGSQATVYNSGTDSNAVLNFGIPKGEKGDTGPMPTIAQTTGQAIDQVMSQKATTDALNTKQATITSSNKLSADLVDDTSTTNKFVTASDITTWNGKQDALTAGTGIDITGGVISTPAIVPEVVAELPTTGAEGKLYLTPKAHTTSTATGNPIEATVTAQAGQLESFQLDGDTFQQSYTGKNLLDIQDNLMASDSGLNFSFSNNELTASGTPTRGWANVTSNINVSLPAGQYTLSLSKQLTHRVYLHIVYTDSTSSDSFIINAGQTSMAITLAKDVSTIRLDFSMMDAGVTIDESFSIQLEAGATVTPYEPYVGGQASPNPSYPQPIQTVTGEQTVSINGTDYSIDLGSIELCKLGTYQDYIYKSGDDWKVHKATAIASASNRKWEWANISPNGWYFSHTNYGFYDTNKINVISKSFIGVKRSVAPNTSGAFITMAGDGSIGIRNPNITGSSNVTQFKNWLNSLNTTWLYARTTPTDTTITDTTLIAQLEAIRTASLENGANTITNTATGTNLAGDMELGYYEYDPTNRYDKFIWLDLNNNYEQIGS